MDEEKNHRDLTNDRDRLSLLFSSEDFVNWANHLCKLKTNNSSIVVNAPVSRPTRRFAGNRSFRADASD